MQVLSTPIRSDIEMQKDLFRFSATLFSETSDEYSALDSQLQMLKCVFLKNENNPMSTEEVADWLFKVFKYHISENEVEKVITSHTKTFETVLVDNVASYKLIDSVLKATKASQENNIDSYIFKFIREFEITDRETCSNAIYNYLYELTTTNINTYKLLISGKTGLDFSENELSVDITHLSNEEQEYVRNFIEWESGDKNIALSNIVFTCLEYCLLVNGDKPNRLLSKSIRKREIYLDTNIIFRALGINGPIRQRTVEAFLKKCNQARLKLIISHSTKNEFFSTIDYYIQELDRYPRGNIFAGAYEKLSDYTLFNHYEEWRVNHPSMSLAYFKYYIRTSYEKMVKKYSIIDGEKIPGKIYNSDQFKNVRNSYSATIKKLKNELHDRYFSEDDRYSLKDSHDATVVHYVEMRRDENEDSDIFFVSSDKILRYWDLSRPEKDYPVVIYPSQLFLILIKTCGRSENDFDSFVSFINVRSAHHQMSAEKANAIISGISTITEDIKTQKILISAICDGEYQNILQESQNNDELYKTVQEVCKRYLEEKLEEKENRITLLENTAKQHENDIISLQGCVEKQNVCIDEKDRIIEKSRKESEEHKEKLCSYAKKKTQLGFILKWYVFPIIAVVGVLTYALFIAFQFVACDAEWNLATKIIEMIGKTTFGKNVEGYIAVIDSALFIVLTAIVIPNFWVKPWDNEKRNIDRSERIEKYIAKNKLL